MSRFAALKTATTPQAAADEAKPDLEDELDKEDGAPPPKSEKKKEKPMTTETPVEQTAEYKAGQAAATARFSAVLASANYAGREALAQNLLGNAALDADAIVAALGTVPLAATVTGICDTPAAAAALAADGDAKDRADMRAQLAAAQPAALGNETPAEPKATDPVDEILAAQRSFGARAPRAETK